MAELMEQALRVRAEPETDLVEAIRRVLEESDEPLTLAKIRAALPVPFRGLAVGIVADTLERQVAAHVFVLYPKYRSQQDRYWDRPLRVHLESLLRGVLREGPLTWSEVRKRLPDYARAHTESLLDQLLISGRIHRHPPAGRRCSAPRFGLEAVDARPYLEPELADLFARCERLGLPRAAVRGALLDMLRDEEWATRGFRQRAVPNAADFHYVHNLPEPAAAPRFTSGHSTFCALEDFDATTYPLHCPGPGALPWRQPYRLQ